jgi:CHAT domain-containing protein
LSQAQLARTTVPRLSIRTRYVDCPSSPAAPLGSCPPPSVENGREAAEIAAAGLAARGSAEGLHATALVELAWSDTRKSLDRSISYLHMVERSSGRPALVLSDLSAAYLLRYERYGDVRGLLAALDYAQRAEDADSTLTPGLYNKALALTALRLDGAAAAAWAKYGVRERDPAWKRESLRHVPRPAARWPAPSIVAESQWAEWAGAHVQDAGVEAWTTLLGCWASQLASDPSRSRACLDLARRVGAQLAVRTGDHSVSDAVSEIDSSIGNGAAQRAFARAFASYDTGYRAYERGKYADAERSFADAARAGGASSALKQHATMFAVALGGAPDAEQSLLELLATVDTARRPLLAAKLRWITATFAARAGRFDAALDRYSRARAAYERAGETENAAAIAVLIGDVRLSMADPGAIGLLIDALRALEAFPESRWRHTALYLLADEAERDGREHAALALRRADLAQMTPAEHAVDLAEAYVSLAGIESVLGDAAGARRDLTLGRKAAQTADRAASDWVLTEIRLVESLSAGESRTSVAAIDSLARFFAAQRREVWRMRALLVKAEIALREHADAEAMRSLNAIDTAMHQQRYRVDPRSAMARRIRRAFDVIVARQLARARADSAAATLAAARRMFADRKEAAPREFAASELQVGLAFVQDTLRLWAVSGATSRAITTSHTRARVVADIDAARAALNNAASPGGELHAALAVLYDELLRPLEAETKNAQTLTLVPDGELARVPYAALYDKRTSRYVIDDHSVVIARDLRVHAPALGRSVSGDSTGRGVAIVVDPAFDRVAFAGLPRLDSADAEGRAIATSYARPVVVRGTFATLDTVVAVLSRATVFHFGGHAIADDDGNDASFLLLAAKGSQRGDELNARRIRALDLHRLELAVLASCEGAEQASGTLAFASLADAFLDAGAKTVVGSLWDADDAATKTLVSALHRQYARTGDEASSLRAAQLQLRHSVDSRLASPYSWAGFEVVRK